MSGLDEAAKQAHKQRNLLHSLLLMAGIAAVLAMPIWLIWGTSGLIVMGITIAALFLLGPRLPPSTVMRLYRAQPVDPKRGGQLVEIVTELARRAELPVPPVVHVIPSMTINAFATGSRSNAAIALTEGLLRQLTLREVAGVLAHEMSHIRNNDLAVMMLADLMSRFAQSLSYVALALAILNLPGLITGDPLVSWWAILLLYLAPAIGNLLQLALSRTREYDADLDGAALTGDPVGLASALRRLDVYTGHMWEDLMLPVPGRRVPVPSVLRSHPDTQERINRLLALRARPEYPQIVIIEEPMVSLVGFGPIEMRPRFRFPGVWF